MSVFNGVENIVGKKCCLPAFFPFPTVLLKGFFLKVIKNSGLCGKGFKIGWLYGV